MSDNFEEFCKANTVQERVCGVAYTINDFQPVICTHIGDQPLYYFDEEIVEEEEEALFSAEELGFLAHEIETLKEEIAGMESPTVKIEEETQKSITLFAENAESMNQDFTMSTEEKNIRLQELKDILNETSSGVSY